MSNKLDKDSDAKAKSADADVKDEDKSKSGDSPDSAAVAAAAVESVKDIAERFSKQVAEMRASAPASKPSGPDPKQVMADYESLKTECNELASNGDFAGAAEKWAQFQANISKQTAGDETETPAYKAMLASARRDARRDHSDMFKEYGSEIEAAVARMSPAERINPDSWDDAVKSVRADHFDEIMASERERVLEEFKREQEGTPDNFDAPRQAPGSRGRRSQGTPANLDEDDLDAAQLLGFTPDEYKEAIAANDAARFGRGDSRGMVALVDDKPKEGFF